MEDGKIILLKACYELLKRQQDSSCVLNLIEEEIEYDGAYCDGSCLLDDIKFLLDDIE